MAKSARQRMKENLQDVTKSSYKSKDKKSPGSFIPWYYRDKVKEWKCTPDTHTIDIIPWEASIAIGESVDKPGKYTYLLDVWVHRNIGAKNENVLCPLMNFPLSNLRCPVCEEYQKQRQLGADWDTVLEPLSYKRRTMYNIWVHDDSKSEAAGVVQWEVAHFFMETNLVEIAYTPGPEGGTFSFADPDEGKRIVFKMEKPGNDNTRFLGHRFVDRPEPIPDHILDQALDLSTVIITMEYNEIKEKLFAGTYGDDAMPSRPKSPPLSKTKEPEKEEVKEGEYQEPESEPETSPETETFPETTLTYVEVLGMDEDALGDLCDEHNVDVYMDDFEEGFDDPLPAFAAAVAEALGLQPPEEEKTSSKRRRRRD